MICRACGGVKSCEEITTYDFMLNKEKFMYDVCADCGTWLLRDIPADIGKYYKTDYYSYDNKETAGSIAHYRKLAKGIISDFKLTESTSVLDYGAGSISLLKAMYHEGVGENGALYKLRAYDKFAPKIEYNGIKLQNTLPTDLKFDFIISKHCIEHEIDPNVQIKNIIDLLSPDGVANFVAPNPDSINARYFKGYWIGIDGPRHINIMPIPVFKTLVEINGGEVIGSNTIGEAGDFLTSELYKQGYKWKDRESHIAKMSNERFLEVYSFSYVSQQIDQGDMWSVTIRKRRND